MKKGVFLLAILSVTILLASNASAFCLWGIIGNTCEEEDDFFPITGDVISVPEGEVIPIDEELLEEDVEEKTSDEEFEIEKLPEIDLTVSEKERENVDIVLEVIEDDLVNLNPKAIDPDGDEVTYEFSEPINSNGLWQTERGDAGKYIVTVTASDGKSTTTQAVLIAVAPANKLPVIECPETIRVEEGDIIKLDCNAFDPDGDAIIVSYEGWLTSSTRETNFQDAGEYTTIVTVSDGENEASQEVSILINDKNRAPTIRELNDIVAVETDVIVLSPTISDPDGDDVVAEFSEPFDAEGIFRTKDGDSGEYVVTITATDGKLTTKERLQLTINDKNTPPIIERISDVVVDETELVKLVVNTFDPEGDELTIIFEGWMDSAEKITTYDDAGSYTTTITVSDGELSTSQEVSIIVRDKNRPPVFIIPI